MERLSFDVFINYLRTPDYVVSFLTYLEYKALLNEQPCLTIFFGDEDAYLEATEDSNFWVLFKKQDIMLLGAKEVEFAETVSTFQKNDNDLVEYRFASPQYVKPRFFYVA